MLIYIKAQTYFSLTELLAWHIKFYSGSVHCIVSILCCTATHLALSISI